MVRVHDWEPIPAGRRLVVRPFTGPSAEWDAFVASCEHGTFCHLSAWRGLLEDVLGHRTHPLAAIDETGTLDGVLPLAEVRGLVTGHYLMSLPFLNQGGPVGSPRAQVALCRRARGLAAAARVDLLELRARHEVAAPLTRSERKITVRLGLPADAAVLWRERFRSKLRSQIRRPLAEGMEIRFGPEQMEPFYQVFRVAMRDLGTPVLPRAWFEGIRTRLAERVVFAAVHWRGRPVAGACGFRWRDEFELTWAASLRELAPRAPNMLLYWGLIDRAIHDGLTVFDFGRCTPGGGTHAFKRQWGGTDRSLPWLQWSPRKGGGRPPADRPLLRFASAAWRRCPLPVADRLGPLLARRLP